MVVAVTTMVQINQQVVAEVQVGRELTVQALVAEELVVLVAEELTL